MNNDFIYAVRDKKTGKLISDLTSKYKKYWIREPECKKAIANNYWYKNADLEIVKFKPIEIADNNYSGIITKDIDALAKWLVDTCGCDDDTPWIKWYDESFCKKCKPVINEEQENFFGVPSEAAECEIDVNRCPFKVAAWTNEELVKAWLMLKKEG